MAAEHVIATKRAVVTERLEAVRSRLSAQLGLSDYSDDDAPGVVKRDRAAFDLFKQETLVGFLEGAATQVGTLLQRIHELEQAQLSAASQSDTAPTAKKK